MSHGERRFRVVDDWTTNPTIRPRSGWCGAQAGYGPAVAENKSEPMTGGSRSRRSGRALIGDG